MAVLEVHEVEPEIPDDARGRDEVVAQPIEVAVAQHPHALREAAIEHRVRVGHLRIG